MIEMMHRREEKPANEILSQENCEAEPSPPPVTAYIPACGTLCDAFWWARRSVDPEKSSD
jgi:hypothetical protein